jgi:hypothetical protein
MVEKTPAKSPRLTIRTINPKIITPGLLIAAKNQCANFGYKETVLVGHSADLRTMKYRETPQFAVMGIIAYFGRSVSTHMLKCVVTKKIALGKIAASCMEIRIF